MAPFRGSRGGKGGRGRGPSRGSGKVARSGIRTRAGYRKFDSARVKEVESEDSGDDGQGVAEELEESEQDVSDEEETESVPTVKAYNALLQSFQQPVEQHGRKRKRRKLEAKAEVEEVRGDRVDDGNGVAEIEDDAVDEQEDAEPEDFIADEVEVDEDTSNPFEVHFANPDDNELSRRLKSIQTNDWRIEKQSIHDMGTLTVSAPKNGQGSIIRKPNVKVPSDLPLKQRLTASAAKNMLSFSPLQQNLVPYVFNYVDLLYGNRTPQNASSLRQIACLHALNHVLKGRDKVLKNTARISHNTPTDTDLDLRDQGFTRPKVLILTETRQLCFHYATTLLDLFEPEQQENKQRFHDSFNASVDSTKDSHMPSDYLDLFAGNNDNNFLTALKLTRKTAKFYSPFYTSDIILASPLGLRRILENEDVKKRDHDFLSSIEIVIVDQADAMQMQNWTNVESVFAHLNLPLKEAHGCDFSRVRSWYLDGHAKYLRQTIVFAAYITPEINRLFNTSMLNVAGKAKLIPTYSDTSAAITAVSNLGLEIKQTFSRFSSPSPTADPDARFHYFTTAILPSLLRLPKPADGGGQGILIFIPTYFDFLRLRNFFATSTATSNIGFGTLNEYSPLSDQRRARAHFLNGRHSILLYTQRAHHFFRLRIRGVRRVVCYGMPDNRSFYEEVVGGFLGKTIEEGGEVGGVRGMFSEWEGMALERVVGSKRVRGMLGGGGGGRGDTFEFL